MAATLTKEQDAIRAAESPEAVAIEARNLVKTYGKTVRALDDLSLSVEAGTVFGLLGPNGAGKSTTVKILTTLSRPDSGSAKVAGVDVLRNPEQVRWLIGSVNQKSGVDREATGRENLMLQGAIFGLRGKTLRHRVDDLLERFDLRDAADRVVKTYSGGMSRRVDIALGLLNKPKVLFLDEPTTGLDPEVRVDMWDQIWRLAHEEHITVLLTTHYLEEADKLARRLAIVDKGKVVAEGTPEELKNQLGGDSVVLELLTSEDIGRARDTVAAMPEVKDVTADASVIRVRVANGPSLVPIALQTLESQGIGVSTVAVNRPSLDDVYLRLTGRSFERADREGEKP